MYYTMRRITSTILLILILGLFSCNNETKDINTAKVQLRFQAINISSKIYIINIGSVQNTVIDSILVEGMENVEFDIPVSQSPDFYILQFAPNDIIRLVLSKGDMVKVNVNGIPAANNYTVSGSVDSKLVWEYNNLVQFHMNFHDSIYSNYREYENTDNAENIRVITDSLLKNNYVSTYDDLKNMVLKNTNSLASILGIYSKFGNAPILDFEYDYITFKELSDSLIIRYPENSHTISLNTRVNQYYEKLQLAEKRYESLDENNKFPHITLNNIDNKPYTIDKSSSKIRLVYLWKANTKSFYEFNKILRNINESYSKEEVEIVAISFEKDKLSWRNYCRMERLNWTNLIADINTEELINPKSEFSLVYVLGDDNTIIARLKTLDSIDRYLQN